MAKHGKSSKKSNKSKHGNDSDLPEVPKELLPDADAPRLRFPEGSFDLDDPVLPEWIERAALASGGYPYNDDMGNKEYERELTALQVELVKLQSHIGKTGGRIVALFEGRDAAGKGGAIFAIHQFMNPRAARSVALPKPTDRERGQWYFQRYVEHLPTAGEIVMFDRSWYNRAVVEPVMGFCTEAEGRAFLKQAPGFESMLVDAGIVLFKFWLDIGREMQLKQFHQRRHNPLKIWKLSPIDYAAMEKWDAYTKARNRMLEATDTRTAPWTVVKSNDKQRARLAIIRSILDTVDYTGKDAAAVGKPDRRILDGRRLLKGQRA